MAEAEDLVNVVPLGSGRVERLTVDVGSEVRKGQVIAELSHGTLDARLQKEQAALRGAQAKLASLKAAVGPKGENAQT